MSTRYKKAAGSRNPDKDRKLRQFLLVCGHIVRYGRGEATHPADRGWELGTAKTQILWCSKCFDGIDVLTGWKNINPVQPELAEEMGVK